MVKDRWLDDVVLVDQLPSNSWVEGLVIRPNGLGLMSRLDQPEIWTVDINTPDAEPQLVHRFHEASGIINICPLVGANDEYVVVSGAVDMEKVVFLDFIVWRVVLSPDNTAQVTKITSMPDAGLLIGATPVTERVVLLADSGKHCVRRLDVTTGKTSVLISDDSMKVESEEDFFGLNRIRVSGGYLWYTNNSAGMLCRVPIAFNESDPEEAIRAAGDVECVVDDIPSCDGLVISDDSSFAYMANYVSGTLWRVDVDKETGEGTTHVLMEHLVSPTSMELHDEDGKKKLYVVCCGELETGWVTDDDRRSWSDIAHINDNVTVSVTVTTDDAA